MYKGDTAVGPIGDVLIFLDYANVTAVVLSVDGFLGLREKLIAVPVSLIKVSSEAKFTTELTKEQLAAAPHSTLASLNSERACDAERCAAGSRYVPRHWPQHVGRAAFLRALSECCVAASYHLKL